MQDEDGFYFLVDRKKDVIVSGGENIYPVQIENFLSAYDKVKDVAVIGLPDKRLGEITGAIISVKDGMECTEKKRSMLSAESCRGTNGRKRSFLRTYREMPPVRSKSLHFVKNMARNIWWHSKTEDRQVY